jgi:hypothetical protein
MATRKDSGWLIVGDRNGIPYWERRSGDVVATVQKTQMNGEWVWRYSAGIDQWSMVGYKDTIRAAKVAASKAFQWYRLREGDFKRVRMGLRLLWQSKGIESVEPMRGHVWDVRGDTVVSHGILWRWRHDLRAWCSGEWRLWYDQGEGWLLRHPDGYLQLVHVASRYEAKREAAFWIGLALGS